MAHPRPRVLFLLLLLSAGEESQVGASQAGTNSLASAISQLVRDFLPSCHLVLVSTSEFSSVFSEMQLGVLGAGVGAVVVNSNEILTSLDLASRDDLFSGLWGDAATTCRALLIEIFGDFDTDHLFR
ncbi:uncharacterized protein [Penaeus vannamei]|uniref:uncharacterized protein n=1 Tax=Penaeus vannamei TaxID=6689 RepID=UPI00387F9637